MSTTKKVAQAKSTKSSEPKPPTNGAATPTVEDVREECRAQFDKERAWVRERIMNLFDGDPGGPTSFLRQLVDVTRRDLELLSYAVGSDETRSGVDLERLMIIQQNRLGAALELDSYFETGHRSTVES